MNIGSKNLKGTAGVHSGPVPVSESCIVSLRHYISYVFTVVPLLSILFLWSFCPCEVVYCLFSLYKTNTSGILDVIGVYMSRTAHVRYMMFEWRVWHLAYCRMSVIGMLGLQAWCGVTHLSPSSALRPGSFLSLLIVSIQHGSLDLR